MAFSDWQHIGGQAGWPAAVGTHSAISNNTLSSPLTNGSNYCRRLYCANNGQAGTSYSEFFLSSSFSSGNFYNIPNTKAIRVQSYVRLDSAAAGGGNAGAFICAKMRSDGEMSSYDAYMLTINTSGQTRLYTEGVASANLRNISMNTWYGFRLEVYPIGSSSDRIKAYIESGSFGSNVWTLLTDVTVNNPSTGYINWNENRKIGFGVFSLASNGTSIGYFDNFSASIANAPTPIP